MSSLEEVARMNRPSAEPPKIEYKRWRHKDRGYVVEVSQVLNTRGKHGYHTVVIVERKGAEKTITWPALTFLRLFEPYGRKMHRKSRYARLMDE